MSTWDASHWDASNWNASNWHAKIGPRPSGTRVVGTTPHDLVAKVLDHSGLYSREFDPHTGHGSIFKVRQFHSPQFA